MNPPGSASAPASLAKAEHQWSLDGLRGLAAISVVLAHFAAIFYPSTVFGNSYAEHGSWESWFYHSPLIVLIHGELAVCIFFVMSGYVLTFRDLQSAQVSRPRLVLNILKRPLRLGGMVLATVILSFLLRWFDLYQNGAVSQLTGSAPYAGKMLTFAPEVSKLLQDISFNLFSSGSIYSPPLWSIRDELWGSWVVFGVLLLARAPWQRWLLCLILIFVFRANHIQGMVLGMMLGGLSHTAFFKKHLGRPWLALVLLGVACLFCCYPFYLRKYSPDSFAQTLFADWPKLSKLAGSWCMVAALMLVGLLLRWSQVLPRRLQSVCKWLGNLSFALYAVHFIVLASLTSHLYLYLRLQMNLSHHAAASGAFATTIPVLLGLSWLLWRWVDVPFIHLSQKTSQWLAARYQQRVERSERARLATQA